jgi:hypothetical protein
MPVVIQSHEENGVRAKMKPGGKACPHLSYEGSEASCGVHDKPEYKGSPCWIYGNPDVDPDFAAKRGRPCLVGKLVKDRGGSLKMLPSLEWAKMEELEDLGPWQERIADPWW